MAGERLFPTSKVASSVRPGEYLEYDFWGSIHYLGGDSAWLEFEREGTDIWYIASLDSKKAGEGKRMVRELVNILGSGQPISASVIEETTIDTLLELDEVKARVIDERQTIVIADKDTLHQLKVVRVLEGGGIITDRLEVAPPSPNDDSGLKLEVRYWGHT